MTTNPRDKKLTAAVYWPARFESAADCTRRVIRFFESLRNVDPLIAQWYGIGKNRSDWFIAVSAEYDVVFNRLLAGRHLDDVAREPIDGLGFSLSLWNGDEDDRFHLSISCGHDSRYVPNVVLLELPNPSERCAHLLTLTALTRLLRAFVDPWEPSWGRVTSWELTKTQQPFEQGQPVLGIVNYLAADRGAIPADLPDPFEIEPIDQLGSLISVNAPQPFDAQLISKLREELGSELLRPIT